MKHSLITITTKSKINEKEWVKICDNIIDVLDKKLLTSGGTIITSKQHKKIWEIVYDRKL